MSEDMKLLDLDAIAPKEEIKIRLNGVIHVMKEMTVEDFVWATKETQEREEGGDTPENMAASVDSMIEVLCRQFPTATAEEFRALNFQKLNKLLRFTQSLAEEGSEATIQKAAAEGKVETMEKETAHA